MKFAISLFFGLVLIATCAYAVPVLTGAVPSNSGFIKGAVNFSVNVSGAGTDTNSVILFIISKDAKDQGEDWDNYTLSCISVGDNSWTCIRSLSFGIVGSNTQELFYFEARDNSGNAATLGSRSTPISITLDRSMPTLYFSAPQNNSYISGNAVLRVSVSDPLSGVDESSVEFYINNTWTKTVNNEITINTLSYTDNTPVTIFARANDKAGNKVNTSVTFIVDNEKPAITVTSPQNNAYISGYQTFTAGVTDNIAGIGVGKVKMHLGTLDYTLTCTGNKQYTCSVIVDTLIYNSNAYNATITATDAAENTGTSSVIVNVNNAAQQINTIKIGLNANEYMRGVKVITAAASSSPGVITGVSLTFKNQNFPMACNSDFSSCSYSLETRSSADGSYTFKVTANNNAGYTITDSVTAYIDNTPPVVKVSVANNTKGTVPVAITITDENPKSTGVMFKAGSVENAVSCGTSGKVVSCTYNLDTTKLEDGVNAVGVSGTDGTGNTFSSYANTYVDNDGPTLRFVKVSPIELSSPSTIEFSVGLNDTGSSVKTARVIVRSSEFNGSLDLSKASDVWYGKGVLVSYGTHSVDVEAVDENGNYARYNDKGQFFVGNLSCGDGVCRPEENYCSCPTDCHPPSCQSNYVVDCSSGMPSCSSNQRCGDNVCSSNESCTSCSSDCGSCNSISEIIRSKTNKDNSLPVISNATSLAQTQASEPITIIKKGPAEKEYVFVDAVQTNTLIVILLAVLVVVVVIIVIKKRPKKNYESFLTPSNPEKF